MNTPSIERWLDQGVTPPQWLPESSVARAIYLTEALGQVVYERWTWQRLLKIHGTLADARRAKPKVCRILIDLPAVVEFWQRGRMHTVPEAEAPSVEQVVFALLKTHSRRFKREGDGPSGAKEISVAESNIDPAARSIPPALVSWLERCGRLQNPHPQTNALGAADDFNAMAAFLRENASRSRHTWRAYMAELERLYRWCVTHGLGPFSDLTRQDLLRYKASLQRPSLDAQEGATTAKPADSRLSDKSQARAVAVLASLFQYWHSTGYLQSNPAAGLTGGSRAQAGFAPSRFVPGLLLKQCDAWVAGKAGTGDELNAHRQAAIWSLFRFSGARLAELAWDPSTRLPRLELDERGTGLLVVQGKGAKPRSIPLPRVCSEPLKAYRIVRGLSAHADPQEQVPLFHGHKRGYLGATGLYREVKSILLSVASDIEGRDAAGAQLLRAASPHWLRHAYARTLVVDKRVPLPAAQALLGHASVQTTAAYAKTDLTQLREFVEAGFDSAQKS